MKINTKFSLNDKVQIIPLKIEGRITGIYISEGGVTFNTRYFHEFKPLDCYFREDELSFDIQEKVLGFK